MAMFKAFKPSGMEKIARAMGYQGNMQGFQNYLAQDPMRQQQMQTYQNKAMQMAKGGVVKMQTGGLTPQNTIGMQPMSAQQQQEARDFVAAGGVPQMPNFRGVSQFAPGNLAQAQNQMQMSGNITGNLSNAFDPRGIQPITKPAANTGTVANVLTGEIVQPEYLTGTKEQYDAFRKQYMQGGPRVETADVRMQPMQGFDFQGSSTEFGAFQDYLRGQQSSQSQPAVNVGGIEAAPGSKYMGGFRQPGDMGRYVAFNDPGQPGEGFANAAAYEAAQQQADTPAGQTETPANVTEATIQRMYQPGLPAGGVTTAAMTPSEAGQYIQPGVGTLTGAVAVPTTMAETAGAMPVEQQQAAQMQAATAAPAVASALDATQVAQGTVDPAAQVVAAQQTASSVGSLDAAQGNATLIDNPVQRNIQQGELISGAAADAQTAAQFTEQIEAAQATPSQQATVQGQLAQLTANFDAANPPAWAAGAMRNATAQMAARGLGASSMAGQAIVQATMESALPIAQADASVFAQFEVQNLSNRQQRAMLSAQQRAQFIGQEFDQAFQTRVANAAKISDIANMNFTAEQQVQLENSRIANTMNLNNLSNRQAMVIAEASALANMDLSNLNNRQQAAVQNAQSFLQMDMANMSNQQQTEIFKAQQRIQSLFTDQAAENAAQQFNATSQNQVDQFFASLANQVSQFNAAQINAQGQFNAGQANTVERFNAELNNQRDQFNAQNQLAIAQANAQWRRQIATADTAAVNTANQINAQAVLGISEQAYENLWQYFADTMEWAWTTADNEADRQSSLAIAQMQADSAIDVAKLKGDYESSQAVGGFVTDILKIGLGKGGFLGF